MSDLPPGPGWWKASDGNWYPPETHPDAPQRSGPGAPPGAVPAAGPGPGGYPVWFEFDGPTDLPRYRALLVQLIMGIPHYIVYTVLGYVVQVTAFISWLAILFTGRMPKGLFGFHMMYLRYGARFFTFMALLRADYPPFEFETTATDPGTDRARVGAVEALEGRNRVTVAFRIILAIPHLIVLTVLTLVAYLAAIVAWVMVLVSGRVGDGVANFLLGVMRWWTRASGYLLLLTDEYPPFSMD